MKLKPIIFSLSLTLLYPMIGNASDQIHNPTSDELIEKLSQKPHVSGMPSSNLFRGSSKTRGLDVSMQVPDEAKTPSVNMNIPFEFNSDQLTADAQEVVKVLAVALQSKELQTYKFLIAGHTDAVGSNEYNLKLSEDRARAVKNRLVNEYGVLADRLEIKGFGEDKLIDTSDPNSATNRRVQISNIGQ